MDGFHSQCQTVVFTLFTVTTAGEHHGSIAALQHAGHVGMSKERDGLVERVARFYIGENEHIGRSVDGRLQTFVLERFERATGFHVERTVYNTLSESACLGFSRNLRIVDCEGEKFLVHLFGAMNQ